MEGKANMTTFSANDIGNECPVLCFPFTSFATFISCDTPDVGFCVSGDLSIACLNFTYIYTCHDSGKTRVVLMMKETAMQRDSTARREVRLNVHTLF